MIKLFSSLTELKGVGPEFAERLKKLEIETIRDLLWHFPFRYDDFSKISKIADLKINTIATISGVISDIKVRRSWKRKMFIIEALINDDSGSIKAIWFNQRFLLAILKKGCMLNLAGKVAEAPKGGLIFSHPSYEIISAVFRKENQETKHTGRLVPIYPETKKVTSKALRFLIKPALDNLEKLIDSIPLSVLKKYKFPEINKALKNIHFPKNLEEALIAKKRFAFEDLFFLQLVNLHQRLELSREKAYKFDISDKCVEDLLNKIPFELTASQKKSLWEILKDFKNPRPMNRLLQGDVGSGKTIVAALAALLIAKKNKQSAFMAPTEVLANQHYQTFKKFFKDFTEGIALLTSSESKIFYGDGLETEIKKTELFKKISRNDIKIIIGTHALISVRQSKSQNIVFNDLALVIVDEQHRFGVRQRAKLKDYSPNYLPHFLSMSATPIPRTLSLTLFGDLDFSIINELPVGRKGIITKVVAPENRDKAYAFIRGQVKKGRQVFVVCPRIEKEELEEGKILTQRDVLKLETKNVKEEYEKLSKKVFPDLRVDMLHGKLKTKEKSEVMEKFKKREIDILVSTSVIEVGVDIPNATIMMIESAEMFGLAQLYQFRGRVGRGEHQSFCFLFTDFFSKTVYQRLQAILKAKNGFELAEKDLAIRGPGEFLGGQKIAQTGMPDLAMKAAQNPELVKISRKAAEDLLEKDPDLENHLQLKKRLGFFERKTHLE
ncbi:ATP-dependent DNA helicase RecG [Candidatus Wolfebacteria bacterium]|nr:ATP-dependent DNA helicase RecG [Candidatus Wolfebacteria bacterium]